MLTAQKIKPALGLSTLPVTHTHLPFSLLSRIGSTYQEQWRKKLKTASPMLFHTRTLNYIVLGPMHGYRSSEIFPKSTVVLLYISNHYHQMNILRATSLRCTYDLLQCYENLDDNVAPQILILYSCLISGLYARQFSPSCNEKALKQSPSGS